MSLQQRLLFSFQALILHLIIVHFYWVMGVVQFLNLLQRLLWYGITYWIVLNQLLLLIKELIIFLLTKESFPLYWVHLSQDSYQEKMWHYQVSWGSAISEKALESLKMCATLSENPAHQCRYGQVLHLSYHQFRLQLVQLHTWASFYVFQKLLWRSSDLWLAYLYQLGHLGLNFLLLLILQEVVVKVHFRTSMHERYNADSFGSLFLK